MAVSSLPLALLLCSTLLVICQAAVPDDRIQYLPGIQPQPSFKQYSGYLKATGTKRHHYWFIESSGDPLTDPLVLWLNGGPGCSSMVGLLQELGPFRVNIDGATLHYNPHTWNKIANILYMESPACVGYSYKSGTSCKTGDDEIAEDNYVALKDFFTKYPEYKSRAFFLTGESYGGIYLPMLTAKVQADPEINYQATAIGNGLLNYKWNDNSKLYFAYDHGLFGESIWNPMVKYCCDGNATQCDFIHSTSTACVIYRNQAFKAANTDLLNGYNIYYDCFTGGPGLHFDPVINKYVFYDYGSFHWNQPGLQDQRRVLTDAVAKIPPEKLASSFACQNTTALVQYMNRPDVRTSLHIPANLPDWNSCSIKVKKSYVKQYNDMTKYIQNILLAKGRVLIYNGDVDSVCNFMGDEWFVDRLGLKLLSDRNPWFYQAEDGSKQIAGFTKTFPNVTFTTIRGAGHFVPTDRPRPAFIMFEKFLKNEPFSVDNLGVNIS